MNSTTICRPLSICVLASTTLLVCCTEDFSTTPETATAEQALEARMAPVEEGYFHEPTVHPALADRLAPVQIDEIPLYMNPLLLEEAEELGIELGRNTRMVDLTEVDASLPTDNVMYQYDDLDISPLVVEAIHPSTVYGTVTEIADINNDWFMAFLMADSDGDCLTNLQEFSAGTDWTNPDTDGDGWFDGPCNEHRRLYLASVKAHDEQEDSGDDESYFSADDIRYPNGDLDDWWDFDDGDTVHTNNLIAERVRGTNTTGQLRTVKVELWEDDWELWNTWTFDDLLYEATIDMAAYSHYAHFTLRGGSNHWYWNWDYEFRFHMNIEHFADPSPLSATADADNDGINDKAEFVVASQFGGITDPYRQDVLVEVDAMPGHGLGTIPKRMVTTQLYRNGIDLFIFRHEQIPTDSYLTETEGRNLYNTNFTYAYTDAFRYAVMSEEIWNGASGVAAGDVFFVDDSTWWINGGVLAQAGTFIHELGHTFHLTNDIYHQIDTVGSLNYDSSMNYLYQGLMVDYSYDDDGGIMGGDHNDWEDVDIAWGLKFSFGIWQ